MVDETFPPEAFWFRVARAGETVQGMAPDQHSKSGGFFRAKNLQNMRIRSRGGIASGFRDDTRMSRRLPANQAEYRNRSLAACVFVGLVREMEG